MRMFRPKNPLEVGEKLNTSLLKFKLYRAFYLHRVKKELMKPNERRDSILIDELFQTIEYINKDIALLERDSHKAKKARSQVVLLYTGVALVLLFSLSMVAQLAGFRIWTAIIRGDVGYLSQAYVAPTPDTVITEKRFASLAEAYEYIGTELTLPETVEQHTTTDIAAPASLCVATDICVCPTEEFGNANNDVHRLTLKYADGDKYMDVEVFIPVSQNTNVFGDKYPNIADYILGVHESDNALDNAQNSLQSDTTPSPLPGDTPSSDSQLEGNVSQRKGIDVLEIIEKDGDVLSTCFIHENILYRIKTNMDSGVLYKVLTQYLKNA